MCGGSNFEKARYLCSRLDDSREQSEWDGVKQEVEVEDENVGRYLVCAEMEEVVPFVGDEQPNVSPTVAAQR